MGKRVGIGIIGAGRIGQLHAANVAHRIPDARLVAISDVALEAAQKCAADLQIPVVEKDYHALLANKEIEAVLICSSTDTHAQIMMDAAGKGKHIFCEKPIALDLPTIDKALEAVRKAGVKLQVGFNRRFDANNLRIRKVVQEGGIGEVHVLRITSRDPAPPPLAYVKVSGGIFSDMTIHDFDTARYLVGSEVEEVFTVAAVRVDPEIGKAGDLDTAIITLKFANGVIGAIDNSRKAVYGYDQRAEVFGSKGMVQAENLTPTMTRVTVAEGTSTDKPLWFFLERYNESYILEMREFIKCLQEGTEPIATGKDGKVAVVIAKAARKSYEEKRPVKVSEIK
jgi:myo-inositol 2-dehydrogenase / D-chiro-inositol 1-dehydrogenase